MKLCILSDSHDNRRLLDHAVADAKARGAEAVLHCGDVVAPTTLRVLQKHGLPVHVVHGNNTGDLFSLGKLSCEPASVVQYHGPDAALEFAGYVGCQTNRPFGIDGESFENPVYLDKLVETMGGEAVKYDQKVTCCGGTLAFSEPEKSQKQIKDIVESAYDHGAEMIVTPCPLCQANVEIYQGAVNKRYGTKFNIPVLYYSQLMTLAYGGSAKEAGLDGHLIKATKLEAFAAKK